MYIFVTSLLKHFVTSVSEMCYKNELLLYSLLLLYTTEIKETHSL